MINQKWENFKEELNTLINENKEKEQKQRLELFDKFIEPYKNKPIKYKSKEYKTISKEMTNLGLRKDMYDTVYRVAAFNDIPIKYIDGSIMFI